MSKNNNCIAIHLTLLGSSKSDKRLPKRHYVLSLYRNIALNEIRLALSMNGRVHHIKS